MCNDVWDDSQDGLSSAPRRSQPISLGYTIRPVVGRSKLRSPTKIVRANQFAMRSKVHHAGVPGHLPGSPAS
jgi:hypothetical protein